jgi:hypothetical protein
VELDEAPAGALPMRGRRHGVATGEACLPEVKPYAPRAVARLDPLEPGERLLERRDGLPRRAGGELGPPEGAQRQRGAVRRARRAADLERLPRRPERLLAPAVGSVA